MNIYEELITAWKREREEKSIISIDIDFYNRCREYVQHLETQSKTDEDKTLLRLFHKRWVRVNYLVNDFISIRMEKIIQHILHDKKITSRLTLEETDLKKQLQNTISNHRDRALGIMTHSENIELSSEDQEGYGVVEFIQNENTESIGVDLLTYGPFKKGDIAVIPKANMRNFILRSKAQQVDIE